MPSCGVCLSICHVPVLSKWVNIFISFSPSGRHTILFFPSLMLWQYPTILTIFQYTNGGVEMEKSWYSTNIWLWHQWLLKCHQQFQPWGKVYHSRPWRWPQCYSEPCLWQQSSTSSLALDRTTGQNLTVCTEQNKTKVGKRCWWHLKTELDGDEWSVNYVPLSATKRN